MTRIYREQANGRWIYWSFVGDRLSVMTEIGARHALAFGSATLITCD